jgi:peptidyl-prolyl cis-trans isomerase D
MALIGKIRKNPLIVLLFIGGGIALFVLSEMTSGAGGPIGPVENAMGRIGEMEIDRAEFERTLSSVYSGGDAYQNRDNLWQFYVNEGLVTQEASDMGLTVSEQELTDLEFGPNPSPVIRRNFSDRPPGS